MTFQALGRCDDPVFSESTNLVADAWYAGLCEFIILLALGFTCLSGDSSLRFCKRRVHDSGDVSVRQGLSAPAEAFPANTSECNVSRVCHAPCRSLLKTMCNRELKYASEVEFSARWRCGGA